MTEYKRTQYAVAQLMESLGMNLGDPNFADTPRRVTDMYAEMLRGYHVGLEQEIRSLLDNVFDSQYSGIVSVTDIDAVGVCPHHLLPVDYRVQVGYIPNGKMVGLSKIPRLVKLLAARPVLQEEFTEEVTTWLHRGIDGCQGTVALVRGHHSCMSIRGVRATHSDTVTSSVKGVFAEDASAKAEFMSLVNNGGK